MKENRRSESYCASLFTSSENIGDVDEKSKESASRGKSKIITFIICPRTILQSRNIYVTFSLLTLPQLVQASSKANVYFKRGARSQGLC